VGSCWRYQWAAAGGISGQLLEVSVGSCSCFFMEVGAATEGGGGTGQLQQLKAAETGQASVSNQSMVRMLEWFCFACCTNAAPSHSATSQGTIATTPVHFRQWDQFYRFVLCSRNVV
jgi:hypothetical protein